MKLARALALGAVLLAGACVVSEKFDDGQFLCNPKGGGDECPAEMRCGSDGLCRHFLAGVDGSSGSGGKDTGTDGNCFPTTCTKLAPKCGDLDDGCGTPLSCGCTAPMTCGGGTVLGQCGCHQKQQQAKAPTAGFEQKITGNVGWQNLDAALTSDDESATTESAVAASKVTNLLKASAFNFKLPPSAVVTGVMVSVERSATSSASSLKDKEIRLLVAGSPLPTPAAKSSAWGTSDATVTYGDDADLWGATAIKPSDVEATDFGVSISVTASASDTPKVDAIGVTVYFSDPACPTP